MSAYDVDFRVASHKRLTVNTGFLLLVFSADQSNHRATHFPVVDFIVYADLYLAN